MRSLERISRAKYVRLTSRRLPDDVSTTKRKPRPNLFLRLNQVAGRLDALRERTQPHHRHSEPHDLEQFDFRKCVLRGE